ncbi:phasin family protein [Pistricoccus aurantiacus]|uniref:phasin family protein n=1 Tax=Pistricoccus aurantiacus TaxID=1883414 RepID=UPI0036414DFF
MATTNINANVEKANQQFESVFAGPARAYTNMMLDYAEKLVSAQREALQVYSELSFHQARAALEIKSPSDFRSYVEEQQKVTKEASERLKADADKVVSINRDFMQQSRELTQEATKRGQEVAQKNMQRGEQQVEDNMKSAKSSSSKK